jgi:NAD+ synthase
MSLNEDIRIDPEKVCREIEEFTRQKMEDLERNGLLVGLSGGVDSCVVTSLSTRAVGKDKVHAIYMPDKDSDPVHGKDASLFARSLGIKFECHPLTKQLRSFSVYQLMPLSFFPRRLKEKLVRKGYRYYEERSGESPFTASLKGLKDKEFSSFLAKGNAYYRIKHRLRMLTLYLTAERNNLLVVGCANRTEYLIGFFVKFGCDHASDIMPILNLYKSQVFMLANYLKIPQKVITKVPSPDVIPGIADEGAIGLPYSKLDLILLGLEKNCPLPQIINEAQVSIEEIEKVKEFLNRSQHMREIYVPGGL